MIKTVVLISFVFVVFSAQNCSVDYDDLQKSECTNFDLNDFKTKYQPPPSAPSKAQEQDKQKYDRVLEWLRSGGASFPKIFIKQYTADYRGVHANAHIKAEEYILQIPLTHILITPFVRTISYNKKIDVYQADLYSKHHTYFSTFLLHEMSNPHSFWKPLLDVLPRKFDSFPMYFSRKDLRWLKGSTIVGIDDVKEDRKQLLYDYKEVLRVAPEFKKYSFAKFKWARTAVGSRLYGITYKGEEIEAMVPLADMMNHDDSKYHGYWTYNEEKESFTIEALSPVKKGKMVLISYGHKQNSKLLVNYGFTLENKEGNDVEVRLRLSQDDEWKEAKKRFFQMDCVDCLESFRLVDKTDDKNVMEFMSFCRVAAVKELRKLYSLQSRSKKSGLSIKKVTPVSIPNEVDMWKFIIENLQARLKKYPTSLAYDLRLQRKNKQLTFNQQNCLRVRIGEKRVLHFFINMGKKMIKVLNSDIVAIHNFYMKKENEVYREYLDRVVLKLQKY